MTVFRWCNIAGLILDMFGAFFLSYGLIISKEKAVRLGQSYWSGEREEENLELPPVKDRLEQSKNAKLGVVFLLLGFVLQIIGNWPR